MLNSSREGQWPSTQTFRAESDGRQCTEKRWAVHSGAVHSTCGAVKACSLHAMNGTAADIHTQAQETSSRPFCLGQGPKHTGEVGQRGMQKSSSATVKSSHSGWTGSVTCRDVTLLSILPLSAWHQGSHLFFSSNFFV